jgi:hypothetical protein
MFFCLAAVWIRLMQILLDKDAVSSAAEPPETA